MTFKRCDQCGIEIGYGGVHMHYAAPVGKLRVRVLATVHLEHSAKELDLCGRCYFDAVETWAREARTFTVRPSEQGTV